jgi:hypothetical protein
VSGTGAPWLHHLRESGEQHQRRGRGGRKGTQRKSHGDSNRLKGVRARGHPAARATLAREQFPQSVAVAVPRRTSASSATSAVRRFSPLPARRHGLRATRCSPFSATDSGELRAEASSFRAASDETGRGSVVAKPAKKSAAVGLQSFASLRALRDLRVDVGLRCPCTDAALTPRARNP